MKNENHIVAILLGMYVVIILGVYFSLVYPTTIRPRVIVQTKIPALSITGLKEVDELFSNYGKLWVGYPAKPDLTKFSFGQKDPI